MEEVKKIVRAKTRKTNFRQTAKRCRFCVEKIDVDYKNTNLLRSFITERGKILPARITGNCAYHQRRLAQAIKRARILALLPFVVI